MKTDYAELSDKVFYYIKYKLYNQTLHGDWYLFLMQEFGFTEEEADEWVRKYDEN